MRLEEFLAGKASQRTFKKGQVVFTQGEQPQAAYFINKGRVEIFKTFSGKDSILAVLSAGEIFGEMSLLRFDEYTLSARAAEDTDTYIITPGLLQDQIRQTHPLIKAMLDMLVDRIHNLNQVLIDLHSVEKNQA